MNSRDLILKAALPLVPFDGWTDYTLRKAAKAAGLNEATAASAFPGGVNDCIDYYFDSACEALQSAYPQEMLATLRVPARIETLLLAQLDYFRPSREALRRAVTYRTLPWNTLRSAQKLYKIVDIIWRLAGDSSTDFNFYTKRMTLAGVYSSTLLFWLNDHSENGADTAAFLKRRLQNVADFGKWKTKIKKEVDGLMG